MSDRQAAHMFEQLLGAECDLSDPRDGTNPDLVERLALARRLLACRLDGSQSTREAVQRIGSSRERQTVGAGKPVRRRRRLVPALAVAGAAVVVLLVIPASRGVIATPVYQWLDVFNIGPHTRVVRALPMTPEEEREVLRQHQASLASGRSWYVSTRYGAFGGSIPRGGSAIVQSTTNVRELLGLTSMALLFPSGMHRGQPITFSRADVAPAGLVLTYFGFGANEILLTQWHLPAGLMVQYQRSVSRRSADGRWVSETPPLALETVDIDGQSVTWDPSPAGVRPDMSQLCWETADFSYCLHGSSLTRDEALAIYRSLRPLSR
jgi:hypothetical protein